MAGRQFMRLRRRAAVTIAALASVAGIGAIGAPAASAATCDNTLGPSSNSYAFLLIDPIGRGWDPDSAGSFYDGNDSDAYDNWGYVYVDGTQYDATGQDCPTELSGRQIDYPEADMSGLKVSRKIYVPGSGLAFSRSITFLRNPSGAPITANLSFEGNLGSDSSTLILSTSSGDKLIADPANDSWATSADDATTPGDPPLAHVWDSTVAPGVADRVDHIYGSTTGTTPWADAQEYVRALYDNVTVPAGATIAYMQIEAQRSTIADANAAAPQLAAQPSDVYAGLTVAEMSQIQNWNLHDLDLDGVDNTADNCSAVANTDQADLDKDGIGDACDNDIDGDGASNADEIARGSNPRVVDTDGDGVNDKADVCPTVPGKGANGCPRFDDNTAPTLVLSAKSKLKRKSALKGIKVSATTNEASTVVFEVFASAKTAKIAKSYNLALASKTVQGVTGKRTITLKPKKSLIGKAKKFTLQVNVTATDAFGNRTIKTKSIKVR
jgi:hypothetical protein